MLFLDMKAVISYVAMLDKRDHAVQDSASGLDGFKFILVFPANDWTGVNAMIRKTAIRKILFQLGYRSGDINRLIMEHHGDDVIGRTEIIRPEIAAFINEDAQFAQGRIPPDIRIAGNIPALDGPGSFDQPQSVS